MSPHTRPAPGRSQRDELERLQEQLRDVRRQREALPRENVELTAQVARLEQEVHWLRRVVEVTRGELERPAASLPEQLTLPFSASPSRRTAYGRLRFALPMLLSMVGGFLFVLPHLVEHPRRLLALGVFLLVCLPLPFLLQGPEENEGVTWSFDAEGFAPSNQAFGTGRVRYSEVRKVEVVQGALQRLFGFGSVRVIWTPTAPTSLGQAVAYPNRSIDIDLLDDPERLAKWLRQCTQPTGDGKTGGARVG